MQRPVFALLTGGLLALGAAGPAAAHHSFAAVYDMNEPITVQGTIAQVRLTNPHSWFYLDVKNDKERSTRAFEAGTPSGMIRNGYKPSVIKNRRRSDDQAVSALATRRRTWACCASSSRLTERSYGLFGSQQGGRNEDALERRVRHPLCVGALLALLWSRATRSARRVAARGSRAHNAECERTGSAHGRRSSRSFRCLVGRRRHRRGAAAGRAAAGPRRYTAAVVHEPLSTVGRARERRRSSDKDDPTLQLRADGFRHAQRAALERRCGRTDRRDAEIIVMLTETFHGFQLVPDRRAPASRRSAAHYRGDSSAAGTATRSSSTSRTSPTTPGSRRKGACRFIPTRCTSSSATGAWTRTRSRSRRRSRTRKC